MAGPKARLKKELASFGKDSSNIELRQVEERQLIGTIPGPEDTPFDGGVFEISIEITDDYPFAPPKMKFITKVWHPNVSSATGAICLDILKDNWSPAFTIKVALLSVQALLTAPEPNDPQDAVVATMYKGNRQEYNATAKYWTDMYAKPGGGEGSDGAPVMPMMMPPSTPAVEPPASPQAQRLMEMGFSRDAVEAALAATDGNEEAAINALLSSA